MRCESSWPCSSFCPSSTFGTGITTTANYWMGWTACDAPSPTACFIERPSSERHTTGLPRRVRGAVPGLETNAETGPKPLISKVEATSGIEPEYTVLQADRTVSMTVDKRCFHLKSLHETLAKDRLHR